MPRWPLRTAALVWWVLGAWPAHAAGLAPRAGGCPADFDTFLARFEASDAFRERHTRYPLPLERIDATARPSPSRVQVLVRRVHRNKYPSVQYPPPLPLSGPPPVRQPVRTVGEARWVRFERPAPDAYALEFVFQPGRRCWQLTEVQHTLM